MVADYCIQLAKVEQLFEALAMDKVIPDESKHWNNLKTDFINLFKCTYRLFINGKLKLDVYPVKGNPLALNDRSEEFGDAVEDTIPIKYFSLFHVERWPISDKETLEITRTKFCDVRRCPKEGLYTADQV